MNLAVHDPAGAPAGISRLLSASLAVFGVLVCFTAAIVWLRLTDPGWLIGYMAGVVLAILLVLSALRRWPTIGVLLERERRVLIGGLLLGAFAYPFFVNEPYQLHVVAIAGGFALMAVGLNVTTGYAGLPDFGYITYYVIGAYAYALLNTKLGLSGWWCLPGAGVAAALASLFVALPSIRVKGHYLALVTLGFASIVILLITNLQDLTGGTQGVSGIEPPALFGHSFGDPLQIAGTTLPADAHAFYLTLVLLSIAVLASARLSRSRWGRAWRAMRGDEVAAQAMGLDLTRLKLLAFATGGVFGGLAGAMYAWMVGYIDPSSFPFIESIFLLAIVALGNWRIGGVIVTALVFTILPEKLRMFDEWRLLIFGCALLIVMLARGRRMGAGGY